jgi:20S proteasome subunit beta 6
MGNKNRMKGRIIHATTTLCCCLGAVVSVAGSSDFDPYQVNGGLLSAVAGRNFVVLAADTRMIDAGGYGILQRDHVSSRIWAATDATADCMDNKDDTTTTSPFAADGSLVLPPLSMTPPTESLTLVSKRDTTLSSQSPVLIGSAGCNADCEQLKRVLRADLRVAHYFGESQLRTSQVANLLSIFLYARRTFPYYSFCLVAGLGTGGAGQVYVYDAIGSYEQVAVATTGTGRELLQPILDGKFRSLVADISDNDEVWSLSSSLSNHQRRGVSDRMQALGKIPLTQVDCSKEEAVSILLDGYRAVSEREIRVGDQVAFCVLARSNAGKWECEVWTAPLKKH